MNPLIFIGIAVFWYVSVEIVLFRLRGYASMPTRFIFWLGLAQSVGTFVFVVCAAVVFFIYNK